jgi:hypothetical protein
MNRASRGDAAIKRVVITGSRFVFNPRGVIKGFAHPVSAGFGIWVISLWQRRIMPQPQPVRPVHLQRNGGK